MKRALGILLLLSVVALAGAALEVSAEPDDIGILMFDESGNVRDDDLLVVVKAAREVH